MKQFNVYDVVFQDHELREVFTTELLRPFNRSSTSGMNRKYFLWAAKRRRQQLFYDGNRLSQNIHARHDSKTWPKGRGEAAVGSARRTVGDIDGDIAVEVCGRE